MSEQLSRPHQTIPTREWSSPERREASETHLETPLGMYGHEFDASQYSCILGVDTLGEGVVHEMTKEFGSKDPGFKVFRLCNFNNPGGTFSGGFLLFGASSRELAERYQREFTQRINDALEGLEAGFRLGE